MGLPSLRVLDRLGPCRGPGHSRNLTPTGSETPREAVRPPRRR
jgi:hypothetical protein